MSLCKNRNHIATYLGLQKYVAAELQEITLLMCLCVHKDFMKHHFLKPLPSPRDADYQDFVPITRKQATMLDSMTKKSICIQDYTDIMHKLCKENGKGVLSFQRMDVSGGQCKFIVSIVDKPTTGYQPFATHDKQEHIWQEKVNQPFLREFEVPQYIVFGFLPFHVQIRTGCSCVAFVVQVFPWWWIIKTQT